MNSNYRNQRHDGISRDRTIYTPYDDYNILEPSPDIDLNSFEDDEDELSDYTLMGEAVDLEQPDQA